jgi:hypothetical protein
VKAEVKAEVAGGEALRALHELLQREGGELATYAVPPRGPEAFGPVLAASERCRPHAAEYELLIETILEGYLVHHARARVLALPDDAMGLLAGDYLYALGLARLAALDDLAAVRELADVIALCAQAHSAWPGEASERAAAAWALGAVGVAGGSWPEQERLEQRLREGEACAAEALETAQERAAALGIGIETERALIAFNGIVSSDSTST